MTFFLHLFFSVFVSSILLFSSSVSSFFLLLLLLNLVWLFLLSSTSSLLSCPLSFSGCGHDHHLLPLLSYFPSPLLSSSFFFFLDNSSSLLLMMSGVLLFVVCLSACCLSVTISIRRLSIAVSSWVVSITIHRLSALSGGRPWDPLCGRGPSSFFRPLFGPHLPSLLGHHSFGQSPLPLGHCSANGESRLWKD